MQADAPIDSALGGTRVDADTRLSNVRTNDAHTQKRVRSRATQADDEAPSPKRRPPHAADESAPLQLDAHVATTDQAMLSHAATHAHDECSHAAAAEIAATACATRQWATHDWQYFPAVEARTLLTNRWMKFYDLVRQEPSGGDECVWSGIRGTVYQMNARLETRFESTTALDMLPPLRVDTEIAMRTMLTSLIGADETKKMHLVQLKLLSAEQGVGLQPFHHDVRKKANAKRCISVLFYCTPNRTADMPRKTAEEMDPAFSENPNCLDDREEMRIIRRLCAVKNFVNSPAPPGTAVAFRTTVCHRGVRNKKLQDRVVVYGLFSPTNRPGQGAMQNYPKGMKMTAELMAQADADVVAEEEEEEEESEDVEHHYPLPAEDCANLAESEEDEEWGQLN
jgi:hypothetical protein